MNLTLVAAVAMVIAWMMLVVVAQVSSGWANVPYAVAVLLGARRILVGAPQFLS